MSEIQKKANRGLAEKNCHILASNLMDLGVDARIKREDLGCSVEFTEFPPEDLADKLVK